MAKITTGWREGEKKTGLKAPTFPSLQSLISAVKRTIKVRLKAYWANKWEKGETGRELYRLVLKILKQRLRVYSTILKTFSTTLT